MHILGLLGGVASGKSLVAEQLQALGAEVLDGDRAGHQALEQRDVQESIRQRWGDKVFLANGAVNRAALAQEVFDPSPAGRAALEHLEQITHPCIRALLVKQLEEMRQRGVRVAVLDAPVMIKAGWHNFCNLIVFVDAPREARLVRAGNRGWSEQEFERRESAQEPLELKRSLAHLVIDNSGTPEETRKQVSNWWLYSGFAR